MRLIMLIALVCLIVALVCAAVPTQVLGWGWQPWITLGLAAWALDVLLGGYVVAAPLQRRAPE